jgi:hypothetical protein
MCRIAPVILSDTKECGRSGDVGAVMRLTGVHSTHHRHLSGRAGADRAISGDRTLIETLGGKVDT